MAPLNEMLLSLSQFGELVLASSSGGGLTRLGARLFVEQNLVAANCVILETLLHLADHLFVCQLAVHKAAAARLLHHLGAIVAGNFAKTLTTVDDRVVDDFGVCKQQTGVGCRVSKWVRAKLGGKGVQG